MRIEDIQSFMMIVSEGSLTSAARALYITQPTLTRRLSELENELGETLVIRHKGVSQISLTDAGKMFLKQAEKWIDLIKETDNVMKAASVRNLSITSSLTPLLDDFYRSFVVEKDSGYSVSLNLSYSSNIYRMVERGETDIGIIGIPQMSYAVESNVIATEDYILITSPDMFPEGTVKLADLERPLEIFMPWGTRYEQWHDYWIETSEPPLISVANAALLPYLLSDVDRWWAIVPMSVALNSMRYAKIDLHDLSAPPFPRNITFLTSSAKDPKMFMPILDRLCSSISGKPGITMLI